MNAAGDIDFAAIMPAVARALCGEPNRRLSTRDELRFGTNGSLSVRIGGEDRGRFYDHEHRVGGGVLDLIKHKTGRANGSAIAWLRENDLAAADPGTSKATKSGGRVVATYDYVDASGDLLFQVVRFEPKRFTQRRPDGNGGWIWKTQGISRVLYRLPELLQAPLSSTIFITEGEKDCDAIRDRLLLATCNPEGAGKWSEAIGEPLAGRPVCILPDADEAGANHACGVARKLRGIAASIRILHLPGLPPKGDVSDWLAHGGTADQLVELAEQTPPEEAAQTETEADAEQLTFGRLNLVKPDQCASLASRPYLLKGLIGCGDHAIAIGQPGAGKSVLGPHLAYAIAQGRSVFGRRVRASRVLYAAAEDGHGMRRRVAALRRRWGDAPGFYLLPQAVDLLSPDSNDRQHLLDAVATLMPDLVVFDTVSRAFPGLAENDSEGMGRVVQFVRTITADGKRAVLTAHHVTKDGGGTPRGHGVLGADVDVVLLVEGSGSDARTVRVTKNRNGPSDTALSFTVETELLGMDEDGDPITAPIAAETEPAVNDGLRGREATLKDAPLRMLREVRTALAEGAAERVVPAPEIPLQDCIARGLLRARLIASGWFDEGLLRTAPNGNAELSRSGYKPENRELTSLSRKGFLAFNRQWVWLL